MPSSIVTGNGNLLIALDQHNLIRDLYFPYVGMEDQIAYQHKLRLGVFVDHQFSWISDDGWSHYQKYIEDTVVTGCSSKNTHLGLELYFNDFVYPTKDVLIRKITLVNKQNYDREVRLFFGQDFHIYGDKQQDTAYYEPNHKALIHYRKNRYFWISGMSQHEGLDSFAVGKSEYRGLEGTWRDAEDGKLEEYPIEQGSIDSTAQINVFLKADSEAVVYFWICAGRDLEEVEALHDFVIEENPEKLLKNSMNYWKSWVNKEPDRISSLPHDLKKHYKQSILILRTQIDNRGAIIAANDSDIMKFNKDTYTYMWPRDGGWVALGLDRAGYGEISKRFFEFCADVITDEGYLMHKYNPDESLGSSWHPWYKDGKPNLPIQEDETGIVVHALSEHFKQFADIEFVQKMYDPLVRKPGNFMMNYVDDVTGLPLPSYDLWEREHGVFSYTAATVYAGLKAAAHLSEVLGHFNHHRRYEKAADDIKAAILKHLYDEEAGRFLKRVELTEEGTPKKDFGLDASLHALWLFGVLPPDDERIVKTNEAIMNQLSVPTTGGLARSENDDYQRVHGDYNGIPGNPWIITTLWHAQWKLALAQTEEDLKEIRGWIDWTIKYMNPAGLLPEQVNPFNGDPLSVAPLTWSHATFVDTVLKYNEKLKSLEQ